MVLRFESVKTLFDGTTVVQQQGISLQCLDATLRTDPSVVYAAVANNGLALQFAKPQLQENRGVVLAAVETTGTALQFAHPFLRADRDVVLSAVCNDALALQYAHDSLRADHEVVQTAVSRNGIALQFADPCLRSERLMVRTAVTDNGDNLQYATPVLRSDREAMLMMLEDAPSACVAHTMSVIRYVLMSQVLPPTCEQGIDASHERRTARRERPMDCTLHCTNLPFFQDWDQSTCQSLQSSTHCAFSYGPH